MLHPNSIFTFIYPSVSSATSAHLPLEIYSPHLHAFLMLSWTFLPSANPSFPSFNLFKPPFPISQYFDEEQDDHEYPYYYEETTDVPSASAHPSPQPGAPNQQVKREQERQKGRRMRERGIEAVTAYFITHCGFSLLNIWVLIKFTLTKNMLLKIHIFTFSTPDASLDLHLSKPPLFYSHLTFSLSSLNPHTCVSTSSVTQDYFFSW